VVPYAAALVLGVLGVNEAWLDPVFNAHFAELVVGSAVVCAGFLLAARWPSAGAVVVACGYPVSALLGAPGPGGSALIAVLVAVAWAGYADDARRSRLAAAGCVVVYVLADAVLRGLTWDTIFFPAIFVPAWWTGTLVRREQERSRQLAAMAAELDAQHEASAHAAVVEERARIAREVHDSVAHSVSVMTLQIGGLRRQLADLLDDRPAEREVMLGLERLGRQSVEELRATVGILREVPEPSAPAGPASLARADELVADVRAAGLEVDLEVGGDLGDLPRAVDVAAYRVVQEALTNVLRHAPQARTQVRIDRQDNGIRVVVVDDGRGAGRSGVTDRDGSTGRDGSTDRDGADGRDGLAGGVGGHGLVGLRERTAMFGGSLDAGPVPGGGFEVEARFPLDRRWS
jgi:signal transduction histidine kinase